MAPSILTNCWNQTRKEKVSRESRRLEYQTHPEENMLRSGFLQGLKGLVARSKNKRKEKSQFEPTKFQDIVPKHIFACAINSHSAYHDAAVQEDLRYLEAAKELRACLRSKSENMLDGAKSIISKYTKEELQLAMLFPQKYRESQCLFVGDESTGGLLLHFACLFSAQDWILKLVRRTSQKGLT